MTDLNRTKLRHSVLATVHEGDLNIVVASLFLKGTATRTLSQLVEQGYVRLDGGQYVLTDTGDALLTQWDGA